MSDKELIKQEIERLYAEVIQKPYNGEVEGEMCAYDKLISFIDSLPEEPASEDLEEEMIRWHKEHFGNKRDWEKTSGEYLTRKSQLDIARHFAEWQKKKSMQDFLEKACDWLSKQPMSRPVFWTVEDFKNYMQDE